MTKKRLLRWTLGIMLLPVVLFAVLSALLYIPPVQDWAVNKAMSLATEGTGFNVKIKRVGLSFPLDIDMRQVVATDSVADTLLCVERFVVNPDLCGILAGRIGIDEVTLIKGTANTKDIVEGLTAEGHIGRFAISAPCLADLKASAIDVNEVEASDCCFNVRIGDMPTDTTQSEPLPWTVKLNGASLRRVGISIDMDSLHAYAFIEETRAEGLDIDLGSNTYSLAGLRLAGQAHAEMTSKAEAQEADTLRTDTLPLEIKVTDFRFSPSRLALKALTAKVSQSNLSASADVWLSALEQPPHGTMHVDATANVAHADYKSACRALPIDTCWMHNPQLADGISIEAHAQGNMDRMHIDSITAELPGILKLAMGGTVEHIGDTLGMAADVNYSIRAANLNVFRSLLGLGRDLRLPSMEIEGNAQMEGCEYRTKASLTVAGHKSAALSATVNPKTERYAARLDMTGLAPRQFMPTLKIGPITASAAIDGQGFDYASQQTTLKATAELRHCKVDSIDIQDLCMAIGYKRRLASLLIDFNHPLLDANAVAELRVAKRDSMYGSLTLDVEKADLHGMKIAKKPLKIGGTLRFEGSTDMSSSHALQGSATGLRLIANDTVFHPKNLAMSLLMKRDTLAAAASAGDLRLAFNSADGLDALMRKSSIFADSLNRQLQAYKLQQDVLKAMLPTATARITMGQQNPVANILRFMGYPINDMAFNLNANPTVGLNGGGYARGLSTGAVTIDTIQWNIYQDTTGVKLDARVCNGPKNRQISFDAQANAYILPTGAGINLTYTDKKGQKGVDIGAVVDILADGISLHLTPLNPIVANRRFAVNPGNYVFMAPDGHVSADLDLLADDGTSLKVYSPKDTTDSTMLQDITLSLHHLNVGELCSVMPFMPAMGGFMYGDAHLMQTTEQMSVSLDARIDALTYENTPIGNVGLNCTYLPLADSCHYIDALMSYNSEDVISMTGTYTDDGKDGLVDAEAEIMSLPMAMIAPLVADDKTLRLEGAMNGLLTVAGSASSPVANGHVSLDKVRVVSPAYNVNLRVEDDTIHVMGNRLDLDEINIYSTGTRPLVMDGIVDFRQTDNITLDTRLTALGYELINAKRNDESVAYGKVLVNAAATLRGPLSNLIMQGRIGILGGTDVTYILQDSPLTVEDRLADIVTFTDFSDTLDTKPTEDLAPLSLTMRMMLSVDQSAQVHCLLSADRSSYVDLEGGGDLTLTYTPQGDMGLTGRYTIISGEMKYQLPIIPLKTFKIESGSYVAWNGKMLNPTLNLSATERVRASVANDNGQNRTVAFDVGMAITQTLENMGLAFTVDAPEDATIQNELATMDAAARGRVAVTMLATGMYITDNGAGGFSTTNALNTFLQGELMGIAGKALNTVDINVGVEEGTSAAGTQTTDYSFSFAKRFWNNRVSISFGGKVSSGQDAENTGATIIDNVSVEYRLDQSATRYVRLSYDKNYESLLEGTITEMGAGLVLRRKTTRLGELFIFRKRKKES